MRKFIKDKPFPYPVLLDPQESVAGSLGIFALPTLLVIDKKGKVFYFESGLADSDTLRKLIKQAGA